MSANITSSIAGNAQRKGMRKGTHSCFECRRRKMRCIFRPEDPNTCVSCQSRGSQCIEQRRELVPSATDKSKSNLKERVAKLEAIIEASGLKANDIARAPNQAPPKVAKVSTSTSLTIDSSSDEATPISSSHNSISLSIDADSPHEIDPIATLFNNAFWRRRSPEGNSGSGANRNSITGLPISNSDPRTFAKRRSARESLLSVLPAPELLGEILNVACSWFNTWKPFGPWLSDSTVNVKPKSLQEFVLWALSSYDPSVIGLAILSIAVSIQQLESKTHSYIIIQLPRMPGELFQEYFELVDRLIVNDSEFASTREGIEVIMMSGKLLMNFGLLKKCWVLNHRAGSYAQLLGLHRPQRLFQSESDAARTRRHRSWLSVCQADVLLSLLLGLPYYADGRTVPISALGESGTTEFFRLKLIGLSARVIDKNQMGLSLSVHTTLDIQKDLDSLAGQMDHGFWDIPGALARGTITREEFFEQISAQFWYHLIRLYLHMPLLIQSLEDPRLATHMETCLEACRDTLRVYHVMRSDSNSAFNMVKVIDYEAFICSALLLLGLMGYGRTQSPVQAANPDQDRSLVLLTLDILRQASTTSDNNIASEAVQGLEGLTALASGACPNRGQDCKDPYAQIVVPYSGTITISPGTFFTNKHVLLDQSAAAQMPVFTLSHDEFQSASNHNQSRLPRNAPQSSFEGFDIHASGTDDDLMIPEYPSIDFDWGSMINMNTEEDWAWLMDLNDSGVNEFI